MKRRLLNLVTPLSMLLCIAIVVAGVRSYFRADQFTRLSDKATGTRLNACAWDWVIDWGRIGVGRDEMRHTYESAEDAFRIERKMTPQFIHQTRPAAKVRPLGGSLWNRLGFFYYHETSRPAAIDPTNRRMPVEMGLVSRSSDHWFIWAPLWPFALATSAPPAAWCAVRLRRRRNKKRQALRGHCRGCGYDLTGNVSGVCPECGRPR